MDSEALFRAGRLDETVQALSAELRDAPADVKRRTFLFELLCFAGEFDRAQKHLDVLAAGGKEAAMGALVYHAALHAERTRQEMFLQGTYPSAGAIEAPVSGMLNGSPFGSLSDADPRIGARLEVFAAGSYLWIPWGQVAYLEIPAPRRLRDLLWSPALLRTGPAFRGLELGEILTPVLNPLTWTHPDGSVRLGRITVWDQDEEGREIPFGQKMLLVDGEEIPLLEVRKLEINPPAS